MSRDDSASGLIRSPHRIPDLRHTPDRQAGPVEPEGRNRLAVAMTAAEAGGGQISVRPRCRDVLPRGSQGQDHRCPGIGWCRAKAPMPSATGQTAPLEPNAPTPPPPRATSPPTPTRIGRGIPGAAPQRGDYGQRSRGNTGAPTPIPFGVTKARRSSAICAVPASRKMIAAHAIACGDIKRKHSGGSHATRCPLLKRTAGGAGR